MSLNLKNALNIFISMRIIGVLFLIAFALIGIIFMSISEKKAKERRKRAEKERQERRKAESVEYTIR